MRLAHAMLRFMYLFDLEVTNNGTDSVETCSRYDNIDDFTTKNFIMSKNKKTYKSTKNGLPFLASHSNLKTDGRIRWINHGERVEPYNDQGNDLALSILLGRLGPGAENASPKLSELVKKVYANRGYLVQQSLSR